MRKLKIIWFWIIVFKTIMYESLKGNEWHIISADCHMGDTEDGMPIRKRLMAKKSCNGFELYWK